MDCDTMVGFGLLAFVAVVTVVTWMSEARPTCPCATCDPEHAQSNAWASRDDARALGEAPRSASARRTRSE